jgi:hypothetical protein
MAVRSVVLGSPSQTAQEGLSFMSLNHYHPYSIPLNKRRRCWIWRRAASVAASVSATTLLSVSKSKALRLEALVHAFVSSF